MVKLKVFANKYLLPHIVTPEVVVVEALIDKLAASVYPGNIVVIIIFSPSMFGHIGQQCELSGLESIKQLRLHSPNFAHIIGITITKYICQDYHQDFISTFSPSPSAPRSSAVSNIMKDHSTKG